MRVVELLTHCPAEIVAQQVMLSSEENKMHSHLHTYILCTKQSGAAQKRCTHTECIIRVLRLSTEDSCILASAVWLGTCTCNSFCIYSSALGTS